MYTLRWTTRLLTGERSIQMQEQNGGCGRTGRGYAVPDKYINMWPLKMEFWMVLSQIFWNLMKYKVRFRNVP